MADDLTKRGEPDRIRINVNEEYEIAYWTRKWGIVRDTLREAVAKVGALVEDVAKEIGEEP
jgi:hypothetical protein